jgi:hypothetical protein
MGITVKNVARGQIGGKGLIKVDKTVRKRMTA